MRYLLMCSALILGVLIGLRFLDEPDPPLPFEGRRIIILAGGRVGEAFQSAVEKGAVQAERDFGCLIGISCTNWDRSNVLTRFQEEMAGVPDGICIIGEPENPDLLPLIESAIEGGITVTSYQREMPEAQKSFSATGFGFAGPDFYRAGQELIAAAAKKHALAPGDLVLLVHDPEQMDESGLYGGAMAAIQSHGLNVQSVEISLGQTDSIGNALGPVLEDLEKRGEEPALVCSLNAPLEFFLHFLSRSTFAPEQLPLVGVDIGSGMGDVLQGGKTHLSIVLEQDLALQTYLAVLQACMGKEYAAVGTRVLTPYSIVDRDTLADEARRQSANFVQRF